MRSHERSSSLDVVLPSEHRVVLFPKTQAEHPRLGVPDRQCSVQLSEFRGILVGPLTDRSWEANMSKLADCLPIIFVGVSLNP